MSDPEASVVTIKDLWQSQQAQTDRLATALGAVERALERLTGHLESIDTRNKAADLVMADQENRLRSLERWRYALPVSALAAVGSAVVVLLQTVHRLPIPGRNAITWPHFLWEESRARSLRAAGSPIDPLVSR